MTQQAKKQNKGRLWLVALIALFVLPMLASWALFYYTQKTGKVWGTSNKGVLIRPMIALQDIDLALFGGGKVTLKEIETQWTMLYLMPDECGQQCEQDIYHMRQVHVSVNKDFSRVQRLLVLKNPEQLQEKYAFLQYYNDMLIAQQDDTLQPLRRQISLPDSDKLTGSVDGHIYIIDPQANVMMVYEKGVDPAKVFKDLKKLLRISRIG